MDSSFTVRPPSGVSRLRPREVPARAPVRTELDAARTVQATDGHGSDQRDRQHEHGPHDLVADPESRDVINRENDIRTQDAPREHPDQALLRLRAYRPARTEPEHPPDDEPHANIKA